MPRLRRKSTYTRERKQRRTGESRARSGARRVGRIVLFAVMICLLVIPVLLIAHPVSYIPLIMAVLIVIVSWAYLRVLRKAVSVNTASMETSCERGEKAGLAITLVNRSMLPCPRINLRFVISDLFGEIDTERVLSCSIGAHATEEFVFDAQFPHLGTYEAGVVEYVVHDLLGLFSFKHDNGHLNQVVVRPARVDLHDAGVNQVMPDESNQMMKPVPSDNEDYASVREYRRGDPLKTVHWNLSSRNPDGSMYTRLFEEYVNPSLAIVIDPFAPAYDRDTLMGLFDGIVECAAALSTQARTGGVDAEVRYINRDQQVAVTHVATEDDADDLIEDMLRITPESDAGSVGLAVEEMLRSAGMQNHSVGNVAFVTARADATCLADLVDIRMRRRNVMAFVAIPPQLEGRERQEFWGPIAALGSVGVDYYAVESNELRTEVVGL